MISLLSTELGMLVGHMDIVSGVVLVVLLGMSIGTWAIFFYKLMQLRSKSRENRILLAKMDSLDAISLEQLQPHSVHEYGGHYIVLSLVMCVERYQQRNTTRYISLQEWDSMQFMGEQLVEETVHEVESGLSFLSTSAAVAPLLGLFGTVWGLVHAFIGIGKMQSTDIASVAPGIAQALITTLAGLLVAIPAVIIYNYLTARIRNFEQELYRLSSKCSLLLQHSFVR